MAERDERSRSWRLASPKTRSVAWSGTAWPTTSRRRCATTCAAADAG